VSRLLVKIVPPLMPKPVRKRSFANAPHQPAKGSCSATAALDKHGYDSHSTEIGLLM